MGTLALLVSWKVSGGPIKMKANIKPLLVSSLEHSVQGEGSYLVEAPISVPTHQVEMKHRKVSSEKTKVESNPFLDKHSPLLDVTHIPSYFHTYPVHTYNDYGITPPPKKKNPAILSNSIMTNQASQHKNALSSSPLTWPAVSYLGQPVGLPEMKT